MPAPRVSMTVRQSETLDPEKNSVTAVPITSGRPMPPDEAGITMPIQPPSQMVS